MMSLARRGCLRPPCGWSAAVVLAALTLLPAAASAQGRAAALSGTARDASGSPLPAVRVTVSSEALIGTSRTVETDAAGAWRADGLPPGLYLVVFTTDGFKPVMRNATVAPGQILTIDARMTQGPVTEVAAVIGDGPLFEGRNPAADAYLGEDLLAVAPVEDRFGPAILAFLPDGSRTPFAPYGSGDPGSQSWLADRADITDARSGDRGVSLARSWLSGVRQAGPGADAAAGAFTGVGIDRALQAGGNRFRGTAELLVEDGWLTSDNVSDDLLALEPRLSPPTLDSGTELSIQAGGPVVRDRMWLFGGWQYTRIRSAPAGFAAPPPEPYAVTGLAPDTAGVSSPRVLIKPTVRLGPAATLTGFVIAEGLDRDGVGAGPDTAPAATQRLDSSARAWNIAYSRTLPAMSLLEVHYSGVSGQRALSPYNADAMGWYDLQLDYAAFNAREASDARTGRQSLSGRYTMFRSGLLGEHQVTLGAALTAGRADLTRDMPGGATVLSNVGRPFLLMFWDGADLDARSRTTSLVVEDRWVVTPRVTLTPGLRVDLNRGRVDPDEATVFSTSPWSPRLGVAWDLTGDSRTVVRAAVGVRHDALRTSFFERAGTGYAPVYQGFVAADLTPIGPAAVSDPGGRRIVADDIGQPRAREFVLGAEHELLPGIFLSANGIWRTYDQFVDDVLDGPSSSFVTLVDPDPGPDGRPNTGDETGEALNVSLQISPVVNNAFTITNPGGAERRYRGFQLAGRKRLSNGWQVQGSWVVSRLTGNYEPGADGGVTRAYDDPNQDPAVQPLLDGRPAADLTHVASAAGSYTLPYGILLSGAYRFVSGAPYTRTAFRWLPGGPADLFYELRGSRRLDPRSQVDVRLERLVDIPRGDLAVTLEGFNLTNGAAVLERVARSGPTFDRPRAIAAPRTFRLGASWRF